MHPSLNSPTIFRRFAFLLLAAPVLFTAGCGGGDSAVDTTTTTYVAAPKTLIGAVIVMSYADGRSFTLTINSGNPNGLSRSDGRISTNWIGAGYSSPVMTIDVAYGAFTPGSVTNVFDDYGLTFVSATTGTIALRENTTSSTFSTTTPIGGTFTITTFPPGG